MKNKIKWENGSPEWIYIIGALMTLPDNMKAIIITEGTSSCHYFERGEEVTIGKALDADLVYAVNNNGLRQALEITDYETV